MNKQPLKTLANCFITDKRYQKEYQQNVLNQYYPSDTLTGTKYNVAMHFTTEYDFIVQSKSNTYFAYAFSIKALQNSFFSVEWT